MQEREDQINSPTPHYHLFIHIVHLPDYLFIYLFIYLFKMFCGLSDQAFKPRGRRNMSFAISLFVRKTIIGVSQTRLYNYRSRIEA